MVPSRIGRARIEKQLWIESTDSFELLADIIVHGCEPRRVRSSLERFKVQFGDIYAIPVEFAKQPADFFLHFTTAIRVLQVHQLAPIQLCVLAQGRPLTPCRMIRPKLLAHMRELEPRIN